jgi:dTDP-4-amino-4,6-dideoxygalactose transaminase
MEVKFLDFTHMHQPLREQMVAKFEEFYDAQWYVLGKNTRAFEEEYARYCGTSHCVGVANGLDALMLSLRVLGVKAGDEVIVPSNTFIASWLAVSMVGGVPVPIEPRKSTYNINPDLIGEAITPRTKAVMPVHLFGQPCEMPAIMNVCDRHSLAVVEDNAQSQGATYVGRKTGSFGIVNATSFYPGKNLGALGDGGAVTTSSPELAHQVATLRNYGSSRKYFNDEMGVNSRLDEVQAGFLSIKLKLLDNWNSQRLAIARKYSERLNGSGDIVLPVEAKGAGCVYHLYVVRTKKRDSLQEYLTSHGVGTLVHYPVPPHLQKAYAGYNFKKGQFPIADEIAETSLSLPIYPGLREDEIEYVSDLIRKFF